MRLLLIEDEPESIDTVTKRLERNGHKCYIKNFTEARTAIDEITPDIVILDLIVGGSSPEGEVAGDDTYSYIWENRFCPIVIYSAHPDLLTAPLHPFVQRVQKGSGSDRELEEKIDFLRPQVDAIKEAESQIRKQFAFALREVAPHAFTVFSNPVQRNDVILRSGRRRLAALIDDLTIHGKKLVSWEKYICPPVSKDIMLGDVLHEIGSTFDDPTVFRIVLTPSCDLVRRESGRYKINDVLVARCCGVRDGFRSTSLGSIGSDKMKERLSGILAQGYFESIMVFPEYTGKIPHMIVKLRDLELVPIGQISSSGGKFDRVASIDSPFRELVAWAYMQVGCRPGMPERDFDRWNSEIIKSCWKPEKPL